MVEDGEVVGAQVSNNLIDSYLIYPNLSTVKTVGLYTSQRTILSLVSVVP